MTKAEYCIEELLFVNLIPNKDKFRVWKPVDGERIITSDPSSILEEFTALRLTNPKRKYRLVKVLVSNE